MTYREQIDRLEMSEEVKEAINDILNEVEQELEEIAKEMDDWSFTSALERVSELKSDLY